MMSKNQNFYFFGSILFFEFSAFSPSLVVFPTPDEVSQKPASTQGREMGGFLNLLQN